MRTKLLIAGFMMAVALPATALAQPYDGCVQQNHDNRAAGTVVGAIGGVTGAVAGNAIAGANNHPCPEGYYYAPPPGYAPPPPGYAGNDRFWGGAPTGIHERIDFMQDRISRSYSDRRISPRESADANRELNFIRSEDQRLRYQSGGRLRPEDRDYLQGRLDNLAQRLHWFANNG